MRTPPLLLLLCCAAVAAAQPVSFSVSLDAPSGALIPGNFVGFSHETKNAAVMLYDATLGAPRTPFVNLMRHLQSYSGGAGPHLRVGGNSADVSEWAASDAAPLALTNDTLRITAADLAALAASVPLYNGSVTLALNMRAPASPALAVAHATAAVDALGWGVLQSFEIGNEPDVYVRNGIRPAGYTSQQYAAEFKLYAAALGAAGVPPGRLCAPTTQGGWNATWFAPFLADVAANLSAVACHLYALSVCGSPPPAPPAPADLLADDAASATARQLARLAPYAAAAAAANVPFHVGEASSVACSGSPGVANAVPAALWALDTCFALAARGVTRINFHGGPTGDNSAIRFPIIGSSPTRYNATPEVAPLFYGLAAFAAASAHGARMLPCGNASAPARVRCWAVADGAGVARIVLINKALDGAATEVTLSVSAPLSAPASVAALLPGPEGAASTTGLTWQGLSWDGSADGLPRGTRAATSLPPSAPGVFALMLPVASAVVITLPPAGPQPPLPPTSPPLPPPPLPPPRARTASPTHAVSARIGVAGVSAASLDRGAFAAALASLLAVSADDVSITSVADYTPGGGSSNASTGRRRALLTAGADVAFSVAAPDASAAEALRVGVAAAAGANAGALVAALRAAGLTGVSGVELTAAPTTAPVSSALRHARTPGLIALTLLLAVA